MTEGSASELLLEALEVVIEQLDRVRRGRVMAIPDLLEGRHGLREELPNGGAVPLPARQLPLVVAVGLSAGGNDRAARREKGEHPEVESAGRLAKIPPRGQEQRPTAPLGLRELLGRVCLDVRLR